MDRFKKIIGVIGSGSSDGNIALVAEEMGALIAKRGFILLCGGLGGIMEAVARGAKNAGGLTIGILPGNDKRKANRFIDIPIVTGLGHARNIVVVQSSDCIVAISGEYGTLSEISIALKLGKPVIGINTWEQLKDIVRVNNPSEAMEAVKQFC